MRYHITLLLLYAVADLFAQTKIDYYAPEIFPKETSGAVCGFSEDGATLYFVREDKLKDKLFIYSAKRSKGKWINEQLLPFSGEFSDMGGRLSPDGNHFYFTSDRPGGSENEKDVWNIWVSHFENNSWSEAEPMQAINNKGNECCPVPLQNGHLIFSSDRGKGKEWAIFDWDGEEEQLITALTEPTGWQWPSAFIADQNLLLFNSMKRKDTKGMDDIYVSMQTNGKWSTPVNLGAPVNTEVYEDGAILSPDKRLLIFNQHTTGATPSQVMCVPWKPLLKRMKKTLSSQ